MPPATGQDLTYILLHLKSQGLTVRLICAAWLRTRATGSKQGKALAKSMKLSKLEKMYRYAMSCNEVSANIKKKKNQGHFSLAFPRHL